MFLETAMLWGYNGNSAAFGKRLKSYYYLAFAERDRPDLAVNMIMTILFIQVGLWKILDPTNFGGNIGIIFVLIVFSIV